MQLSIFETLANGKDLETEQLIHIKKVLAKIIDKGGITVVCTDTFITTYNCNKSGQLTK